MKRQWLLTVLRVMIKTECSVLNRTSYHSLHGSGIIGRGGGKDVRMRRQEEQQNPIFWTCKSTLSCSYDFTKLHLYEMGIHKSLDLSTDKNVEIP